jgi:hypothetical protein
MFAILRARFAHSKKWISHFGICLLAGAGLVAALAPAGAAASARQAAPTARPFFFRRRELYDPLLPPPYDLLPPKPRGLQRARRPRDTAKS